MNTDFPIHFAKQLAGNPSLFGATKETMLAELLSAYVNGTLSNEDAAEVESLLRSDSRARTIHDNILTANRYIASDDGKAWLENLPGHVLPPLTVTPHSRPAPTFFAPPTGSLPALAEALTQWFVNAVGRGLPQAAADGDIVIAEGPIPGHPSLFGGAVKDAEGNIRIRVSGSDTSYEGKTLEVTLREQTHPMLRLRKTGPELVFGQVVIPAEAVPTRLADLGFKLVPSSAD